MISRVRVRRAWLGGLASLAFVLSIASVRLVGSASTDRRPIALEDILAWKSIAAAELSPDGRWFAYRLSPLDGDSEVVIRETRGAKEYRIPVGDWTDPGVAPVPPAPPAAGGAAVEFSKDSRWAAVTVRPSKQEAERLRRQRKPVETTSALVDLATGDKVEVSRVRRFAFSGEQAGWIALHRYPPDAAGPGPGADGPSAGPGGARAGTSAPTRERPKPSDLLLRELATGAVVTLGNVTEFAFDRSGRWLAYTVETADQVGNGLHLRDLETARVLVLDSDKAVYERPTWTERGDGLAVLKGVEHKAYKDRLYAVVAFAGFGGELKKVVYDPAADGSFPKDMTVAATRAPRWTEDLSGLVFGIRKVERAPEASTKDTKTPAGEGEAGSDEDTPDLVIWHWRDPRLQSQQQVQEARDREFSYLAVYRVAEKRFIRLADEEVREVTPAPHDRWAVGRDTRAYELDGNLDGRRFEDLYVIDMRTGERRPAVTRARWTYEVAPTGDALLYYEDGHFFVHRFDTGETRNLTLGLPVSFVDADNDQNIVKPPVRPVGWSAGGDAVLLSDGWDVWKVPVREGLAVNLTGNGRREQVRYRRRYVLDREEKGIDLARPQYFEVYGEWTKKAGIARLDPGAAGARRLFWEDAQFARLMKAERADVYLYTRETFQDPPDYFVTDAGVGPGTKITDLASQQAPFAWSSGVRLVDYTSDKGDKLQAALFLPANYEPGTRYPTIVYIYERLSQGLNAYTRPSANGFNKSVYTSHGYAVLMPDIRYRVNDPGMSAVWCVLPAVKAAIETGVVDPKRVGLHGHSWGGYQTAFLVTQTNLFAAAVAGAPLTNMVSMYSLIYKNTGGTNQAIFESSQGRFRGGYWDHWEAYYRNSPVFFAKNVATPLLILHNDRDGAVDFTQGVEYYNTLRRLKKPVVMLQYVGENHSLRKPANQRDYTVRMKEFFDHYLKGEPAPTWLTDGVPRLEMDRHLEERAKRPAPRQVKGTGS